MMLPNESARQLGGLLRARYRGDALDCGSAAGGGVDSNLTGFKS